MFHGKAVMELAAVYHDPAAFIQLDQPAVYIVGHSLFFYQNKFQLLMPMADGRIVRVRGQESVCCISGEQGLLYATVSEESGLNTEQ
jgi:hypothetical protein